MIKFNCSGCGNEFNVEEAKAGLKGRCPNCKAIIKVPERSIGDLEIIEDNKFFASEKLNALYGYFMDTYESKIITHSAIPGEEFECVFVSILTDTFRHQNVFIYRINLNDGEYVGFLSNIGVIFFQDTAVAALRTVGVFSQYTLSLSDDNRLQVSAIRKLKNLDEEEFSSIILDLANYADNMEEAIFGQDVE